MNYLITTKEEWEAESTNLGRVFDTPEEAVEAATRDWGNRVDELVILHVVKVVEVKQSFEFSDYKGQTNE